MYTYLSVYNKHGDLRAVPAGVEHLHCLELTWIQSLHVGLTEDLEGKGEPSLLFSKKQFYLRKFVRRPYS